MSPECVGYVKFYLKIPNRSFFTACLNCHFLGLRKTRCYSVCPLNANKLLLDDPGGGASRARAQSLRTISSHGMMIISETLSNGVHFEYTLQTIIPTESECCLEMEQVQFSSLITVITYLSSACMYPLFINSLQVGCFGPGPNDDQTYTDEFNKVYCT